MAALIALIPLASLVALLTRFERFTLLNSRFVTVMARRFGPRSTLPKQGHQLPT